MKTTLQELKSAIKDYVYYQVRVNTTGNHTYETIANNIWKEKLAPFIKNEDIQDWTKDIKTKFLDNPYVRFEISEKQAYCLAKSFATLNPNTISL